MDTAKVEHTAEDLISHTLQRSGILVAKPKFDQKGADLLAFSEFEDGVKFCRIQSKGRSLVGTKTSNITIPKSYVSPAFIVFLYIDTGDTSETNLYCFFSNDIQQWNVSGDDYQLNISLNTFKEKLEFWKFDDSKSILIKQVIENAMIKDEFKRMVYGRGTMKAEPATTIGKS